MVHQPKAARRRAHLGQHGRGNAEQLAQPRVPCARMDVEEHGAACVGGVGCVDLALGKVPDKPRIHRAECQLARLGALAGTGNRVQDPGNLRSGIVSIGDKPRSAGDLSGRFHIAAAPFHDFSGTSALPHNGVANRLARNAVPHHRGFALVRYADAVYLACRNPRRYKQFGQNLELA